MARCLTVAGSVALLLALAGCNHAGSPPTAADSAPQPNPGGGIAAERAGTLQSAVAEWTLTVDPTAGTAEAQLVRQGQDNDGLYRLPIGAFLTPSSLRIESIKIVGDALQLTYVFTHPFKSSTSSNRADLGFSGFMLFQAKESFLAPAHSYFDPPVVLNTSTIVNPDAYWKPEGLVSNIFPPTNCYPYKLLVSDGGNGNRLDGSTGAPISNGGGPTGNFDPTTGWQTLPSESWTGYDVLHQGQAARSTLKLRLTDLQYSNKFHFNVWLIAKYNDPRSAAPGALHRLPSVPPDMLGGFGYRYPEGALDVSKVSFEGESGGLVANAASSSTLRFHVRDWDARATETAGDLADDPIATHVVAGGAGTPQLDVCIPALFGTAAIPLSATPIDDDSGYGGDVAQDSGAAGDGLFYEAVLNKPSDDGATNGIRDGLVRVTDVEAASEINLVNLDGSLFPITGTAPAPVTYQTFQLNVATPLTKVGWARGFANAGYETGDRIWADPAGKVYVAVRFSTPINFGGGVRTPAGYEDVALIKLNSDGTYLWDRAWGNDQYDKITGLVGNADGSTISVCGTFSGTFQVHPDAPVWVGSSTDGYVAVLDADGGWVRSRVIGGVNAESVQAIAMDSADNYLIGGEFVSSIDFGTGPITGDGIDPFVIAESSTFAHQWHATATGPSFDYCTGVCWTPGGAAVACGGTFGGIDWGHGMSTPLGDEDLWIAHLDGGTGAPDWDYVAGGANTDHPDGLAAGTADQIVSVGHFSGETDLGGGTVGTPGWQSGFCLSLSSTGAYQWSGAYGGNFTTAIFRGIAFPEGGDLYLLGDSTNALTFGGGLVVTPRAQDAILVRLDPSDGTGIWGWGIGDTGNDQGNAIVYGGPDDELYTTGSFQAYPGGTADLRLGPDQFIVNGYPDGDTWVSKVETDGDW